jgi:hypothetical protein
MTLLGRSIVRTTGYIGAPGINVVHWSAGIGPGPDDPDAVDEFHDTLSTALINFVGALPTTITWTIDPQVVYFDASDGVLLGSTADPGAPRAWTGDGSGTTESRATQLCMRFNTGAYVNGRELQGRMFLGPVSNEALGSDGQITSTLVANTPGYMSGLISGLGGRLAVWHRPTTPTGTDGSYADVTSITMNATPGTLRSRKT